MSSADLPITALCVVSERSKCPPNYTAIWKSSDTSTDTDLWKDGLFGKKINRFICFTKDYPIADTYNVIEDIKLLNERESLSGFIQIEKCLDTSEKAFQKKVLCIKVSHRFFTTTAVSDIILLSKTKRAPMGYNYIGEINNHLICIKFAQIPTGQQASVAAPPIPPRPYSMTNMQDENGFVIVNPRQPSPPQNGAGQQQQNHPQHNAATYNPLSGVPFEINPAYNFENADNRVDDIASRINRKLESFNMTLEKMDYNFGLERSCLT